MTMERISAFASAYAKLSASMVVPVSSLLIDVIITFVIVKPLLDGISRCNEAIETFRVLPFNIGYATLFACLAFLPPPIRICLYVAVLALAAASSNREHMEKIRYYLRYVVNAYFVLMGLIALVGVALTWHAICVPGPH